MSLLSRLRGVLRIERLERDLDEELRTHVEMRSSDNESAGMTPEEARYEAHRQFGAQVPHFRYGHSTIMGVLPPGFTMLGVNAQLGRTYTVADSLPGFTEGCRERSRD